MSDFKVKMMIGALGAILAIMFIGIITYNYKLAVYPSYEGDFMVSGLTGEGTLDKTIQTNKISYDVKNKVWECTDKNNGETYYYKDNILIERVYNH